MKWNSCVEGTRTHTHTQREDKKKETVVKDKKDFHVFRSLEHQKYVGLGDSRCDKRGEAMPSTCCLVSHLSLDGPVTQASLWSIIAVIRFQQMTMWPSAATSPELWVTRVDAALKSCLGRSLRQTFEAFSSEMGNEGLQLGLFENHLDI